MDVELRKLSDENKQALLEAASEGVLRRRDEGVALLKRLGQLNSTLAEQFEPKFDALSKLTLRMLCRKAKASVPSFLIISYCWHYKEWPLASAAHPIYPGWEISQPMVDKILSLRESENEGVWLDKLCIDQKNEDEKKVAIGSMDVIYRSARRLVILLEDVQLNKEEGKAGCLYAKFFEDMAREVAKQELSGMAKTNFLNTYFSGKENEDEAKKIPENVRKQFIWKVLSARWFTRAWCAHESRVVPHLKVNNPLFLCFGSDGRVLSFEYRFILFFASRLGRIEAETHTVGALDFLSLINDPNPSSIQQLAWRMNMFFPDTSPDVSIMQQILSISNFTCGEQGDLLSIALNTCGIPLSFRGSLKAKEDIFWIFSLLVLASGELGPLITKGSKLKLLDECRKREIVSWVDRPDVASLDEKLPILSPNSISRVEKEFIELDLLVFTQMPANVSQAAMEEALTILGKYHLLTHAVELGASDDGLTKQMLDSMIKETRRISADGPDQLMNEFLQTYLGCAIDCGIDWIRRFPSVMREGTEGSWIHGTFDRYSTRFTDAAVDLLRYLDITKENTSNFEQDYLQPTIRFFTCLVDNRLKFLTSSPRRIQAGAGDFALTPVISNKSWVAVPVATAHLPLFHKRAWIIEPFDPDAEPENPEDYLPKKLASNNDKAEVLCSVLTSDYKDLRIERNERGTWRLRRRHPIFGCQPIVACGSWVILLERQKVYGAEDYDWAAIGEACKATAGK